MGEISDALRRAERERADRRLEPTPAPRAAAEPRGAPRPELPPPSGPVAQIPRDKLQPWNARALLIEGEHVVGEHFRQFALHVADELARLSRSSVLVTSSVAREGKTLTACNLALALASMASEHRIALVDLDLRRPSLARSLGFRPATGIEQVLSGEKPLAEARATTDVPHLDVFPALRHVPRAHELLSTRALAAALAELEAAYHVVVIDVPPALLFPDVSLILPQVGACIAVVRSGTTLRKAFRELIDQLPPEKLIGCFLNEVRLPRHARRYSSYYGAPDDSGQPEEPSDE